jgi:hypothetical protein
MFAITAGLASAAEQRVQEVNSFVAIQLDSTGSVRKESAYAIHSIGARKRFKSLRISVFEQHTSQRFHYPTL